MSKQSLRFLGAILALAGSLILAYAAWSYLDQQRTEAALEAQVPGQVTPGAATTTPILLAPAANAATSGKSSIPTPELVNGVSPSVTPILPHSTPVQPDETTAANLARTPTAISLVVRPAGATESADAVNVLDATKVPVTAAPVLAGVVVPTVPGSPTLNPQLGPQGAPRGQGSPATGLVIPKLNLNVAIKRSEYAVFQQGGQIISDWVVPYDAAGHLSTTAQPGEVGNAVLSGHHNLKGPGQFGLGVFAGLWNLTEGDEVRIQTQDGKTQLWRVTQSFPIKEGGEPLAVRIQHAEQIMADTPAPTLTLLTCWNGKTNPLSGNTYRWIVHAQLISIL